MQKELWEKEAEHLYFVQDITIDDWYDFIRKIIIEAKEEARKEAHTDIMHEQQKMLDGFAHSKECEICLSDNKKR